MPTVAKAFSPADIFQGPADLWLDLGAPVSAVPPVQYTNTLQLDATGAPPDSGSAGVNLGLTEGPCSVSIHPKFNEIRADQFAAPVDAAFVSLACEIDFNIKELNLARFPKYFAGILTGTYTDVTAGANPACDFLQIGSNKSSQAQLHTLMLIAPRRDVANKWIYVFAYKTYLKSAITLPLDRKKETVIKLKFGCIADTARVAKDQVLQMIRMT